VRRIASPTRQQEDGIMSTCPNTPSRTRVCTDAKQYVERQLERGPKVAVVACEGACVKGEVARVAANMLAYQLEREHAVRICLGDAATADSGMRDLVSRAPRVIAVEGCPLHCATEILKARMPDVRFTTVTASSLYEYDRRRCFEIFDMPAEELASHARVVAEHVQESHFERRATAHPSPGTPNPSAKDERSQAVASPRMQKGNLEAADIHVYHRVRKQSLTLDGVTVTQVTFDPGARWSVDLASKAGTKSCASPHVALVLSGALRVRMDDGSEEEFGKGDVMLLPPGHDAWTVGEAPCVFLDFSDGYARYGVSGTAERLG
jgi:uncharacterized metal-binding protein/quercetin dioxygenase-like cupin family protein